MSIVTIKRTKIKHTEREEEKKNNMSKLKGTRYAKYSGILNQNDHKTLHLEKLIGPESERFSSVKENTSSMKT